MVDWLVSVAPVYLTHAIAFAAGFLACGMFCSGEDDDTRGRR